MTKHSRFLACAVFLVLFCAQSTPVFAQRHSAVKRKVSTVSADKIISLTNAARVQNDLSPLVNDPLLTVSAQKKASDMAKLSVFAHDMPDGRHPWDYITAAGYAYGAAGENLAVHFLAEDKLVEAWMNSPTHRQNILNNKFKDIGIGVAYGTFDGRSGYLVVQHLGAKQ